MSEGIIRIEMYPDQAHEILCISQWMNQPTPILRDIFKEVSQFCGYHNSGEQA
jgi:hypothetical protein